MEITKRNLVLIFGTPTKSEESITITNPADLLTSAEIKTAMSKALETGVIGENVQANSIVGAKYVIQQVDEVDLEEV